MSKIHRFEDIEAWQMARTLTVEVYQFTQQEVFGRDYGTSGWHSFGDQTNWNWSCRGHWLPPHRGVWADAFGMDSSWRGMRAHLRWPFLCQAAHSDRKPISSILVGMVHRVTPAQESSARAGQRFHVPKGQN